MDDIERAQAQNALNEWFRSQSIASHDAVRIMWSLINTKLAKSAVPEIINAVAAMHRSTEQYWKK